MRLLYLASIPLSLIGCFGGERANSGQCPAGETCSALTPRGLEFVGNKLVDEVLLSGPRATAIGGSQVVALQYDRGDGVSVALDLPFTADDDGGLGIKVSATSGSQVTVLGEGSRSNYLRILDQDGLLMDRKELAGADLKTIQLVPVDYESVPADMQIAFAPGKRSFGVALYGDVQHSGGPQSERLVDTGMTLELAGATTKAWDTVEIANATVGTSTLSVTAGDKPPLNVDVVVVDHADTVEAITPPTTIMANGSASVCFKATSGSRYIAGLVWTFTIDGQAKTQGEGAATRNCVTVSTTKTTGSVAVQATAGGQSASLTLAVGQAARSSGVVVPMRTSAPSLPTAGDRAAL